MAMPGDHITARRSSFNHRLLEQGLSAIREGGHTVGDGRGSTVIE